jgi:sugar lactone lactonase YvrE
MTLAAEQPSVSTSRFGVARLAERFGITEGQVYTLAIGLVIGLTTAAIGIPPTLRDHPGLRAALRVGPPADAPGAKPEASPSASPPDVGAPPAESYASPSISGASSFSPSNSVNYGADQAQSPSVSGSSSNSGPAYADGGKLGDVEKVTTVGSPGAPSGIAVDDDGGFYVATDNGGSLGEPGPSKVLHYSATGTLDRTYTISGQPESHARGLSAVVLDHNGHLFVLDAATARVLRIDLASGAQTDLTKLNDLPTCSPGQTGACEPGLSNNKPVAQAAALTSAGDLLVADSGQGMIWKVGPTGATTVWDSSSDYVSPDVGPAGLAVDRDGSVLLVVSKSVMAGLGGIVYRVTSPGTHTKLYGSDPNSTPNGIAVGSSGRIYLAATGANSLIVLDKSGAVVQKITSPAFSKPFGMAWRGHSLLLTNQSPAAGDDPSSWNVLRAATEDSAPA